VVLKSLFMRLGELSDDDICIKYELILQYTMAVEKFHSKYPNINSSPDLLTRIVINAIL
jgi:hypothetical protein